MSSNEQEKQDQNSADAMWQKLQHRTQKKAKLQGALLSVAAALALIVLLVGLAIILM